jgi:hypothetical protein
MGASVERRVRGDVRSQLVHCAVRGRSTVGAARARIRGDHRRCGSSVDAGDGERATTTQKRERHRDDERSG